MKNTVYLKEAKPGEIGLVADKFTVVCKALESGKVSVVVRDFYRILRDKEALDLPGDLEFTPFKIVLAKDAEVYHPLENPYEYLTIGCWLVRVVQKTEDYVEIVHWNQDRDLEFPVHIKPDTVLVPVEENNLREWIAQLKTTQEAFYVKERPAAVTRAKTASKKERKVKEPKEKKPSRRKEIFKLLKKGITETETLVKMLKPMFPDQTEKQLKVGVSVAKWHTEKDPSLLKEVE